MLLLAEVDKLPECSDFPCRCKTLNFYLYKKFDYGILCR